MTRLSALFVIALLSVACSSSPPPDDGPIEYDYVEDTDEKPRREDLSPIVTEPSVSARTASTIGLAGFQGMVDSRRVEGVSARGGFRYIGQRQTRRFRGLAQSLNPAGVPQGSPVPVRMDERDEFHGPGVFGGASFLDGLFDVGFAWRPWQERRLEDRYLDTSPASSTSVPSGTQTDNQDGVGDLDLSFSVRPPLDLPWLHLAPFVSGRAPTAEVDVRLPARLEYGLAVAISPPQQQIFSLHLNASGETLEEGGNAFLFRVGPSLAFELGDSTVLRFFGYANGREWEGRAGTDLALDFGFQLALTDLFESWDHSAALVFEFGGSFSLIESRYRSQDLKRALRSKPVNGGNSLQLLQRHPDERAEAIQASIQLLF